jgi:hypothetical protein
MTLESKARRMFRDEVEREVRGPLGVAVGILMQTAQKAGPLSEAPPRRDGEGVPVPSAATIQQAQALLEPLITP